MKKIILVSVFFLSFIVDGKSTHFVGGEITYRLIDSNIGRYRITLSLYRDCAGINYGTEKLKIKSSSIDTNIDMILISRTEITQVCQVPDVATKVATNCPNDTNVKNIKGVEKWVYQLDYNFGKNKGWVVVGSGNCCRSNSLNTINNPGGQGFWIQAVFNTNYRNNSPVFTNLPIQYVPRGYKYSYNPAPVDSFDSKYIVINGKNVTLDSFGHRLYTPFTAMSTNANNAVIFLNPEVDFVSPLNMNNFLFTTTGVNFDASSASVSFTPSIEQDPIYAFATQEWRAVPDGSPSGYSRVMVGYITRENHFIVRPIANYVSNFIIDSFKNLKKDTTKESYFYTQNDSLKKIYFRIKIDSMDSLKYKLIDLPRSNELNGFNLTFSGIGTNNLEGVITFDTIYNNGIFNITIEAYYCNSLGLKVSKTYVITIDAKVIPGQKICPISATIKNTSPIFIASNSSVTLIDSINPKKSSILSYQWYKDGLLIPNSNYLNLTVSDTGCYYTKLIVDTPCTTITSNVVCVKHQFVAPKCVDFKNITMTSNGTTWYFNPSDTNVVSAPFSIKYNWTFSNGQTSAQRNPTTTFTTFPAWAKLTVCIDSGTVTICCDSSRRDSIINCAGAININGTMTNIKCFGASNGTIAININGGTPPYIYKWSNSSSSSNLINLNAGNYTVTVTDVNSCTASKSFTIQQPAPIMLSLNKGLTYLKATYSGGTSPFNKPSWSNGATTDSIGGLTKGQYCVIIIDANGCTAFKCDSVSGAGSSIQTSDNINSVYIYRNQLQNTATLEVNLDKTSSVSYKLFNIQGRLIQQKDLNKKTGQVKEEINLESLTSGIYILNITINGKETSLKVVKE